MLGQVLPFNATRNYNNYRWVSCCFSGGASNRVWGPWNGSTPIFTEIMEFGTQSTDYTISVGAAWGTLASAASTGDKTVDFGANAYYGVTLLALRPAQTPGSEVTNSYTYTGSSQTFTVPNCVTSLTVEAWGGGGGGFNGSKDGGGKGGGGGGYAKSTISNPTGPYAIVVGQGGGEHSDGKASTFGGSLVVADYGRGGTDATTAGGAGGTSNTGNVTTSNGGNGGDGNGNNDVGGGGGGAGGKDGAGIAGTNTTNASTTGGSGGAGDNGSGGAGGVGW